MEYPGYTEELFYDKAGNRTRRMAQGVEELYQYDPRNRLIALTKGGVTTRFQYDNAGNLLADDKARYSYDAFNRTTKVETFDGNVQINRYDAEVLRYEMEENGKLVQFIFNQDREAVTEEDSTDLTRLIRSTELIARSTDAVRTYYHYASDEMGSTTHIVDETGKVQNRYEYDAWGNITVQEEAVSNRFTYYGQQLDPITQQYYLRARFYNPVIARFTQEDTYRGDGLNLYSYCANNPVYYVDPSGFDKTTAWDKSVIGEASFEGNIYRNTQQKYDPLVMSPYTIDSNHRYTQKGTPGLYFSTGEHIVVAECGGADIARTADRMTYRFDVTLDGLLDLSNPTVREKMGIKLDEILRPSGEYTLTHSIGEFAIEDGYTGIIAPSSKADGGVNIIIFDPETININGGGVIYYDPTSVYMNR